MAVYFPCGGVCTFSITLDAQATLAWTICGVAILHWDAISSVGLLQCLSLHLLVRSRPFSVSGKLRNHYPDRCWYSNVYKKPAA